MTDLHGNLTTPAPPPPPLPSARKRPLVFTILGWGAIVSLGVALIMALLPIDNPGVQSCGTPAAFMAQGRVNLYPDAARQIRRADGSVQTLNKAQLDRAFDHPCTARVSARMVPVFWLAAVGLALGLITLIGSAIVIFDEKLRQPLDAFGHRARKPVYRRRCGTDSGELVHWQQNLCEQVDQ